jgi:hypothetical protein
MKFHSTRAAATPFRPRVGRAVALGADLGADGAPPHQVRLDDAAGQR